MTRYILLFFVFMAWGFYELSGGADFKVGPNTLARMEAQTAQTVARADTSATSLTSVAAPSQGIVSEQKPAPNAADPVLDVTLTSTDRVQRALVPTQTDAEKLAAVVASDLDHSQSGGVVDTAVSGAQEPAVLYSMADLDPATRGGQDIREVAASRVNMRDGPGTGFPVVSKLSQGDQVMVLQDTGDGWLKLQVVDTDRIGWMADFLVTASSN
jgi:hypothetical protein